MSTLSVRLQDLTTRIATECKSIRTLMNGNAASNAALLTTAKTSLLLAINELHTRLQEAEGAIADASGINDDLASDNTTYSSNKINAVVATKPSINDVTPSTSSVYSGSKTKAIVDAKPNVNDGAGSSTTDTYSIDKIRSVAAEVAAQTAAGKAVINDAATSSTTATYSIDKIKGEISQTAQAVKDEILGGAGAAYDTLKELQDLFAQTDTDLTAFNTALANRVRVDTNTQGLTQVQRQNARTNIDAYGSEEIGDPDTDLVTVFTNALV